MWSLSLCTFYKSALAVACPCELFVRLKFKTVISENKQTGCCYRVHEEETDSCQEDGVHRRAASIEKQNLHRKIEGLCNQLVTVYTNMVGSFIRAVIAYLCNAVSFNCHTLCLEKSLLIGCNFVIYSLILIFGVLDGESETFCY